MLAHPQPLSHVSIGVRNLDVSKKFYSAILLPLGLGLVYESHQEAASTKPRVLGYGPNDEHELINIFEYGADARPPGKGSHIAFNALTREAVETFHSAAVSTGGVNNGEPGLRENYGCNYFATSVVDPDGWKLEAVCTSSGSE